MLRKTLSVILTVAMLCTMLPVMALAETATEATATVIAVDDKSATIEVAGVLTEGNTYSNPVVMNGAVTLASSITGDEIVVTGLSKATKYNLTVSFDENGTTHTVNNVAVNTLNTLPCMTAPMIYPEYLESIDLYQKLTITPATAQNASNAEQFALKQAAIDAHKWVSYDETALGSWWGASSTASKAWAGTGRTYVEAPLEFPATGNYYVVANLYGNGAGREITVWIDGVSVKDSGADFVFNANAGTYRNVYCPTPVNVTKGVHTIKLQQSTNWSRVQSVAFIPEAEVNAAGGIATYVPATFADGTSSSEKWPATYNAFIANHTPAKKVFYNDGTGIDVTENNKVLTVDLFPTTHINSNDVTYNVYLNGEAVETGLSELTPTVTISEGVVDGVNTVKVAAVIDGTEESYEEANVIVNLPADAPFFMNGAINNVTALNTADIETVLDVAWTAAQQQVPTGVVTYNVYINDELADNTANTTYSFTGLTANTEYDVKVITVLDGTESEESIVSTLENTFKTPAIATADLESVVDTKATIKVTGSFTPVEDYKLFGVSSSAGTATVDEDGVVTITGLTPATKYDLTVTVKESKVNDESVYKTHSFPVSVVTTKAKEQSPAPQAIYPDTMKEMGRFYFSNTTVGTYDAGGTAAKNDMKWVTFATDSGRGSNWFEECWYGSGGVAVQTTLNFSSAGDYYIAIHGNNYNGTRSVKVAIDGVTVQKDGADFKFGTNDNGTYLDTPVTVAQGDRTIKITNVDGYRLDMLVFIPKTEVDASGKTLAVFVEDNLATKDKFLAFANRYKNTKVFSNDGTSLSIAEIQPKVLEVTIFPTTYVGEVDATFKLYLNGTLVATLNENTKTYTINQNVLDGKNTVKIEAIVGEAVNSEDSVVLDISAVQGTATLTVDGSNNISAGTIALQAPAFLTGSKDTRILVAAYKNNRMEKLVYTTKTLSAGQTASEAFTVLGETAKLLQQEAANDPAVRSVKLYLLDNDFAPVDFAY